MARRAAARRGPTLVWPESTTYWTPAMVSEVSAMVVAMMILRAPRGAGANARSCASRGSAAYNGHTSAVLAGAPRALLSCAAIMFASASICSCPGRNARISPPRGCSSCSCMTVQSAASTKSSSGSSAYSTSTACCRPGTRTHATGGSKNRSNSATSSVALITTTRSGGEPLDASLAAARRRCARSTSPQRMSVCSERSCACATQTRGAALARSCLEEAS